MKNFFSRLFAAGDGESLPEDAYVTPVGKEVMAKKYASVVADMQRTSTKRASFALRDDRETALRLLDRALSKWLLQEETFSLLNSKLGERFSVGNGTEAQAFTVVSASRAQERRSVTFYAERPSAVWWTTVGVKEPLVGKRPRMFYSEKIVASQVQEKLSPSGSFSYVVSASSFRKRVNSLADIYDSLRK